jgi:hypothetical protein
MFKTSADIWAALRDKKILPDGAGMDRRSVEKIGSRG